MTTLNRLKKIVENNCSPQPELTISEVNRQLLIAKKATTLGKQFTAILTIVNRYPSGSVPTDIHTDLLKYDHILELIRLIKLILLMKPDNIVETNIAFSPTIVHTEDKLKEQYQIVVDEITVRGMHESRLQILTQDEIRDFRINQIINC